MSNKKFAWPLLFLVSFAATFMFSYLGYRQAFGSGAIYYVSQSTANGYAVGSDSNTTLQAQSKATPWLTLAKANTVAVSGDTVVVNDGTYSETSGSGFLNWGTTATIAPETQYGATIRASSGAATRVMNFASSDTATFTLGAFILDAQGLNNAGFTISGGNSTAFSLVLSGTRILNTVQRCLNNASAKINLTVTGVTCTSTTNTIAGIEAGTITSGSLTVTGSTFTLSGFTSNQSYGITGVATVTGITTSITNNTINMTSSSSNAWLHGILTDGVTPNTITGNTITFSGASNSTQSGIFVRGANSLGYAMPNTLISGNTINNTDSNSTGFIYGIRVYNQANILVRSNTVTNTNAPGGAGDGINITADPASAATANYPQILSNTIDNEVYGASHMIVVGTDGSVAASDNKVNYPVIAFNVATGRAGIDDHGIMIGSQTGGWVYGNKVTNSSHGVIAKLTLGPTYVYGNEIWNPSNSDNTGQALRAKGANDAEFFNNTVYMTSGSNGYGILADADSEVPTPSTGCKFYNNIVYATAAPNVAFAKVDATSDATFKSNDYFLTAGSLNANPWTYQSTNYQTFSAWQAARETTAVNVDPLFVDVTTNFKLKANTTLYHAGSFILMPSYDYLGRPFFINTPTIGAYEFGFGSGAQARTART